MKKVLTEGATIHCDACGVVQEYSVEDYVIQGLLGEASRCHDECWNCGASFSVEFTGDEYIVRTEV